MLWRFILYAGLSVFILSTVLASFYYTFNYRYDYTRLNGHGKQAVQRLRSGECKQCLERYDGIRRQAIHLKEEKWQKQEAHHQSLRIALKKECNAVIEAIISKRNTPLGSNVIYDGENKKNMKITPKIFSTFPQESPFINLTYENCSVVGNGGILEDSGCGIQIDNTNFVIRCNLPPLNRDVGYKTNLVTANPSTLFEKFAGPAERHRHFVDSVDVYGTTLLALPAFSYKRNTAVSFRALNTLQDFKSQVQPIFLNPKYLQNLAQFWRHHGFQASQLSSGFTIVSLALELCHNIHIYGFWPFTDGLEGQHLKHHYYDDCKAKTIHNLPAEFRWLLTLHKKGILQMHLGKCK
ncbi:alpha-2,8-sialyltransferase 8F isoform X2 [Polypterus senegalus]|uniref:alpha-2,8-sialyltransferase 8F isoform X2 n=1 Tax=Polypterus senegalus TaxID=55291 RepID=UPI0019647702|nr:alpha-2,8-sialyltransferase 8F isoform X2 [Polypterus senegalus]